MRDKGRIAALGAAMITMLAIAAPAQAITDAEQRQAERQGILQAFPSLELEGTKRYEIRAAGTTNNTVTMVALRKTQSASYSAPGRATASSMSADFGDIGSLDVTFTPKGERKDVELPEGCTGTPGQVQKGTWKGSIVLNRSFTQVDATKAKGEIFYPGDFECTGGGGGNNDPVVLSAINEGSDRSVAFQATEAKRNKAPFFLVNVTETVGDVAVQLSAAAKGEKGDFRYDLDEDTARVDPPKPFKGRGELKTGAWTGDLTAKVPGEKVDLITGFTAQVGKLNR